MSGLPWIPLDVGFSTGEHAVALRVALQEEFAWARVVKLWSWVAVHRADGKIEGPAAVQIIEAAAGWTGAPGAFVEVLCLPHIGLLDQTSSGFYVHNWHLHCGAHIEKREKDRARHRTGKKTGGSKKPPRKLRGDSKEEGGSLHGESAQEREREKEREKDPTTHTHAREAGAADREAFEAKHPHNASPLTDDVVKALRAAGRTPAYPSPPSRAPVEAAIAGVGVPVATARILAAWSDAKPWLTFYLEAITGQNGVKKGSRVPPVRRDDWEPAPGPPASIDDLVEKYQATTGEAK